MQKQDSPKIKTIQELNELYEKAETVDKRHFAEQRSNILLVSGEHYKKTADQLARGLEKMGVNKDKRLRLVKNHTQKITSDQKDIFLAQVSSFRVTPRNESEMADTKAADISNSVWSWGSEQIKWDDSVDRFVNAFVDIGEVACKVFHDPNQGKLKAYEQAVTDEGFPIFVGPDGRPTLEKQTTKADEMGNPIEIIEHQPMADKKKPIFSGRTIVEKLYAFNLLRDPSAQTMQASPYLIYRHMKTLDDAKRLAQDEEAKDKVVESSNQTYKIFDSNNGEYYQAKGQVMIREFYFRACHEYPAGYYYIATDNVILQHGPIPFGEEGDVAFPIKHTGYDIIETSPRFSSPIRPLRPYQAEINRTASSISETQITMGPDKIILKTGGTFSKGVELSGMRSYHVSGPEPIIVPGRSGEQYVQHLSNQIEEMYMVARLPENVASSAQVTDPKAELFKSVRQRARFTRPQARLERFLQETMRTWLFLAQKYMPDDEVIMAAGRSEAVNISEFKAVNQLSVAIKIEPVGGDYNTMFGKSLEIEMVGQYFGTDMPMDVKMAMIRSLPYLNKEPAIKELALTYDAPMNMLLALDRGEQHMPNKYSDETVMLNRLYVRLQQADYALLPDEVKANYEKTIQAYEAIAAQKTEEKLRLAKGIIPTGGNLVKVDYYIMDENGKQVRGTFPSESLDWLKSTIEAQGLAQDRLEQMHNAQGMIDVAGQIPPDAFVRNPETTPMQPQMEEMNAY